MRDWPTLRKAEARIAQLETDLAYWKGEATKLWEEKQTQPEPLTEAEKEILRAGGCSWVLERLTPKLFIVSTDK